MSVSFAPDGPQATQAFTVENTSNEKIAVEISMAERKMDIDGKEDLPSAAKLFNVFPSQLILEPNATRVVRVTWMGEKNLSRELPYRLIAEQLPVSGLKAESKGRAIISILVRYIASIYIDPPGTEAKISVKSVSKIVEKNKTMLAVEVVNQGNKHKIINEPVLKLTSKDTPEITLNGDALLVLSGQNVLGGTSRRFLIPWAGKGLEGTITGSLKVQ